MTIENAKPATVAAAMNANISDSNELVATARDVTAEARAKGYFNTASAHIPDAKANNNSDIVKRNGMRVHAGGEYQPTDLLMIDGMEVTYEMAQSLGFISGSEFTSPQADFAADSENTPEPEAVDSRPLETRVLQDQFKVAFGENSEAALNTIGQDIANNGQLSEQGLAFLNEKMGVSEQSYQKTYSEMQEVGGQVMSQYLETGDGLGMDRIDFLVGLAEEGTRDQQATVRNIWFKAAIGQLTREQAIEAFDHLWEPYA